MIKGDKSLMALWSVAVMTEKGDRCLECGAPATGNHHIIHRSHMLTRYDPENGIPLCTIDHHRADSDQEFAMSFLEQDERESLTKKGKIMIKDYLAQHGLIKQEWAKIERAKLRAIINLDGKFLCRATI